MPATTWKTESSERIVLVRDGATIASVQHDPADPLFYIAEAAGKRIQTNQPFEAMGWVEDQFKEPGPASNPASGHDDIDLLATLRITKTTPRPVGGTWVTGSIGGHAFEALVFEGHAENPAFELGDSRISKLYLQEHFTHAEAACFDRGWDRHPTTPAAKRIVDLLAAGLAETVFGK